MVYLHPGTVHIARGDYLSDLDAADFGIAWRTDRGNASGNSPGTGNSDLCNCQYYSDSVYPLIY